MATMSTYNLYLFHETPKGWLVGKEPEDRENDNAFWLAKSVCRLNFEATDKGKPFISVDVPEWLAGERGLDPSIDGEVVE